MLRFREFSAIALAVVVPAVAPAIHVQQMSDIGDVRKHVGETTMICGPVTTYSYPAKDGSGDCTLRLDIGEPYWNPLFYVLFKPDPGVVPVADLYVTQRVCVSGAIQSDRQGVPFVAITAVGDLEMPNSVPRAPLVSGTVQTCELGVVPPKLTEEVKPIYPADEFRQRGKDRDRSTKTVVLEAAVDATGRVSAWRTLYAPSQSYSLAAVTALRHWRFKPATRNGPPISTVVQVQMTFNVK